MSDSEPDENFVTPYGSPRERQHELENVIALNTPVCNESLDIFTDGIQTDQSQRNRAGSYSADDGRRRTENANSKAKHRLGSIDICKDNLSSAPPCASRSVSLDDGVKTRISQTYDVNWEGATRQRGVVLVSDGQRLITACLFAVAASFLAEATLDVWVTNSNGGDRLSQKSSLSPTGSSNGFHISVNRNKRYQYITGFGAALTNAAAYNLYHSPQRDQTMQDLFGKSGISMSYLRLPMGGTDFQGVQPYTYDDLPSWQHNDFHMDHFTIQKDQDFIIPIIKQALTINPSLRIIATPWTAPAWMKTTNSLFGGEFHNGNNYQQAYAQYLVKFIQEYQKAGIEIDAICLQNEPKHSDNAYPTMKLSWETERDIIKNYLGPAFNQHSINTKIIIYDHNWDDTSYAGDILADSGAAQYISGSAWHCYGGRHDTCGGFHNQHPDKDIYFTECSGGDWAPGFNIVWGMRILSIGQTRNWAKTVMYWNLALDDHHGPKVGVGGCNNCNGVITIHGDGGTTKNAEYYIIGHMSKFVYPEAVRLDTPAYGWDDVHSAAFQNNDGSIAVVVLNPRNDRDQSFYIDIDGHHYQYTLPRESVATFVYRS